MSKNAEKTSKYMENAQKTFGVKNTLDILDNMHDLVYKAKKEQKKKDKIEYREKLRENIENTKCISCCPNKLVCCYTSFCKPICKSSCYLSYYHFFMIQLIFSLSLHVFDVGSDIYVLIDLYNKNLFYFGTSLGIITLSFIASSISTGFFQSDPHVRAGEPSNLVSRRDNSWCTIFCSLFLGFIQVGIFIEAYYSLKIGEKTHTFIWGRVLEGLLESCPQSLFQLFIIMKESTSYSLETASRYYVSITISLLNLSLALLVFEFYRYRYENIKRYIYREPRLSSPERGTSCVIPSIIELKICSSYGCVLYFYRLFEISSRMGLLASIGYMFNGYAIVIALVVDHILNTAIISYRLKLPMKKCRKCLSAFIFIWLREVLSLPAYWKPFTTRLPGETDREHSSTHFHWLSKYINNSVLSCFLIYELTYNINNVSVSFVVISITSMSMFVLSIPCLFYIIKWNRHLTDTFTPKVCCSDSKIFGEKKYLNKFQPFKCCSCCFNKRNTNTVQDISNVPIRPSV